MSRFLERPPPWRYSKAESLAPEEYRPFAYALTAPSTHISGFKLAHVQHGFQGISLRPPFLRYEPKIHVLERQPESSAGSKRTSDFFDL